MVEQIAEEALVLPQPLDKGIFHIGKIGEGKVIFRIILCLIYLRLYFFLMYKTSLNSTT